jgi:signal transduction histidine kinase
MCAADGGGSVVTMRVQRPPVWDVLLAAVAAAALILDGSHRAGNVLPPGDWLLAVLACAPLAWRTRFPLAVLLAVMAGALVCIAVFEPNDVVVGPLLLALYSVAEHGRRRQSFVVGAFTAVVVVAVIMVFKSPGEALGPDDALRLVLALGALVVGETMRTRRELAAAAVDRAQREAREREDESRRRVADERLRIARDLHDTLAHALVAINVRAGVAVHLDEGDPAALRDIKDLSAEALTDLRGTLSLLRDQQDAAPTSPALDLRAVSDLVARTTASGVPASAQVDLSGGTIPSAVGQAGFRIVQEAMTNILRHANASAATVRVTATSEALEIDVRDDGRGSGLNGGGGHGLHGMKERAAAIGGEVIAGPQPAGGWRVHARLPLSGGPR